MRGFLLLSVPALLAACNGNGDGKDDGPTPDDGSMTFTTYNAGLAVAFVPAANERAEGVAQAVAQLDSDFICLQEVWLPEHVALFEAAAAGTFDHTYFPAAQQTEMTTDACDPADLDPLITCINDNCDVCDDELVDCLFARCLPQFFTVDQNDKQCAMCVESQVGTGGADEAAAACGPGGTGIEYAYHGSFGTGILSKYPITVEEVVFSSTLNRRGLLHATVETPEGSVDAWCTHLTAGLSSIPFPRDEGSWEEEQQVQVTEFAALLANAPDPVVVMGDLNNGPATSQAEEEFVGNYDIVSAGFSVPFVEQDGRCTFCPDNDLSSVDSDETGKLIDHVMLRGFDGQDVTVRRDLDQSLTVESCGAEVPGNHSDHYGISVTITP